LRVGSGGAKKEVVSMSTSKPLWRRAVDAADRAAAPVIEGATRHEAFRVSMSALRKTQMDVYRHTERISTRVLHGLNLPTASDVNRLLTQIAAVENRVRALNNQMEDLPVSAASQEGAPLEPTR
jgi:hypothetical protein